MKGSDDERKVDRSSKKREKRELLNWCSSCVGIPLSSISQVQNGAVFCYITSLMCTPGDFDLSLVNYMAEEECECLANYRLLQSVARAGKVRGLNHKAKLRHWGRLAVCEADAWEFLALLRKCLTRAGMGDYCVDIQPDATPPPAPFSSRRGQQKKDSSHFTAKLHEGKSIQLQDFAKGSFFPPRSSMDQTLAKLAEELISSHISDGDACLAPILTSSPQRSSSGNNAGADAPAGSLSMSRKDRYPYARNFSGASTISARDPYSNPASPLSSASEQEQHSMRSDHLQMLAERCGAEKRQTQRMQRALQQAGG